MENTEILLDIIVGGGSLCFADPINGLGISYVTKEINTTMGIDQRALLLIKKFYDLLI